ncbi:hypothetical protein BK120_21635 [Paenibacillus sp. FSL A5-0031]|uniref:hypothetical protein n=1 Tax=Paenibacillus sp. FSL A5-0031 TaxID=1920420 RepID=UPI00096D00A7|nr:hypothetical protein [Paenibacillus sp. FSL A5-0031]OME79582.1 hypothetical protein BK120_21635 [Paenibacillus sp. FSL A5-0031]
MKNQFKPHEEHGNIIKTIEIGNSTIIIRDKECVSKQEDIDKILDEFSSIGWAILEKKYASENE